MTNDEREYYEYIIQYLRPYALEKCRENNCTNPEEHIQKFIKTFYSYLNGTVRAAREGGWRGSIEWCMNEAWDLATSDMEMFHAFGLERFGVFD